MDNIEKLNLENNELRQKIEELEKKLAETNLEYEKKIKELQNKLIDQDYESMPLVEQEAFEQLDLENKRLRALLDDFYKSAFKSWQDDLRSAIKKL